MQSTTNLIKIGYKIRKLEQLENQISDIYVANGSRYFEYSINFLLISNCQTNSHIQYKVYRFVFKIVFFACGAIAASICVRIVIPST